MLNFKYKNTSLTLIIFVLFSKSHRDAGGTGVALIRGATQAAKVIYVI